MQYPTPDSTSTTMTESTDLVLKRGSSAIKRLCILHPLVIVRILYLVGWNGHNGNAPSFIPDHTGSPDVQSKRDREGYRCYDAHSSVNLDPWDTSAEDPLDVFNENEDEWD